MSEVDSVARALFYQSGDMPAEVADALFDMVDLSYPLRTPSADDNPGRPTKALADPKKLPVDEAEGFAAVISDPEVLAKLAKRDTRVTVRNALLLNQSIDDATLFMLLEWAAKRGSIYSTIEQVTAISSSFERILTLLRFQSTPRTIKKAVELVRSLDDAKKVLEVRATATTTLVAAAIENTVPFTLEELLPILPTSVDLHEVSSALLTHVSEISPETAEFVTKYLPAAVSRYGSLSPVIPVAVAETFFATDNATLKELVWGSVVRENVRFPKQSVEDSPDGNSSVEASSVEASSVEASSDVSTTAPVLLSKEFSQWLISRLSRDRVMTDEVVTVAKLPFDPSVSAQMVDLLIRAASSGRRSYGAMNTRVAEATVNVLSNMDVTPEMALSLLNRGVSPRSLRDRVVGSWSVSEFEAFFRLLQDADEGTTLTETLTTFSALPVDLEHTLVAAFIDHAEAQLISRDFLSSKFLTLPWEAEATAETFVCSGWLSADALTSIAFAMTNPSHDAFVPASALNVEACPLPVLPSVSELVPAWASRMASFEAVEASGFKDAGYEPAHVASVFLLAATAHTSVDDEPSISWSNPAVVDSFTSLPVPLRASVSQSLLSYALPEAMMVKVLVDACAADTSFLRDWVKNDRYPCNPATLEAVMQVVPQVNLNYPSISAISRAFPELVNSSEFVEHSFAGIRAQVVSEPPPIELFELMLSEFTLTDEHVVELLNLMPSLTRSWLTGLYPNCLPTLDLAAACTGCASALAQICGEPLTPLLEELCEDTPGFPKAWAQSNRRTPASAKTMLRLLSKHLGDEPSAWKLALSLFPEWTGSLRELCETAEVACL